MNISYLDRILYYSSVLTFLLNMSHMRITNLNSLIILKGTNVYISVHIYIYIYIYMEGDNIRDVNMLKFLAENCR